MGAERHAFPVDTLTPLLDDLAAEHAALDAVIAPLDAAGWDRATPSPGWAIRHQIGHLTYFDEQAALDRRRSGRLRGRARRGARRRRELRHRRSLRHGSAPMPCSSGGGPAGPGLLAAFDGIDPKARLPWYGPPMSARSFLTARLMETWAHGVDVTDALGVAPSVSERLRHVAHLGVVTRGWSYAVRGLEAPPVEVFVSLRSPSGDTWTWGDADPRIGSRATALDFCLVVSQRRDLGDTGLHAEGADAAEWLSIAQIFAGGATTTTARLTCGCGAMTTSLPARWRSAAHHDDVEFGAGATLARWAARRVRRAPPRAD